MQLLTLESLQVLGAKLPWLTSYYNENAAIIFTLPQHGTAFKKSADHYWATWQALTTKEKIFE